MNALDARRGGDDSGGGRVQKMSQDGRPHMLDDMHIGAAVVGRDGRRLGTLKRVVVERGTHQVTHIVIDPGLVESGNLLAPGGWERPRERVVPLALVTSAGEHQIAVACDEDELRQRPLFEHETYVAAETPAGGRSHFRAGDLVNYIASAAGVGAAPYEPPISIQFNEAAGSSEIAEGTPVWRLEPHEEVGEVDHVLLDGDTRRVTAIVLRRKGLLRQRVVLPIGAVTGIEDGVVHASLDDDALDALAHYQPEE